MPESAPRPRLVHLDALRGVAILGILPVNAVYFGMPVAEASQPVTVGSPGTVEGALALLTAILAEYKFVTVFSLLFGMGMALMREATDRRGGGYAGVMVRRLLALGVVGLLHASLLWYGDILTLYAPLGLLLCWTVRWSPGLLRWLGGILLAVGLAAGLQSGALEAMLETDPGEVPPDAVPTAPDAPWPEFLEACATGEWWVDPRFETGVIREGGFARASVLRAAIWAWTVPGWCLYFGWRVAGLFLLGMAAVREGWLTEPARNPAALRRTLRIGLALGLPLEVGGAVLGRLPDGPSAALLGEVLHYLGSLALAAALVAGVCLAAGAREPARWVGTLAACGRTAFSNYLLQSLLVGAVFASWGLGGFGRLDRVGIAGMVVAVWAVEVAASALWLRCFRMGPLEWLWRWATYLRRPPLLGPAAPRRVPPGG